MLLIVRKVNKSDPDIHKTFSWVWNKEKNTNECTGEKLISGKGDRRKIHQKGVTCIGWVGGGDKRNTEYRTLPGYDCTFGGEIMHLLEAFLSNLF